MLLVCLCSCLALLVAPIVTLESGANATCTENGECMATKTALNSDNENGTDSAPLTYYEVTDDLGNKFNISILDIKTLLTSLSEKHHHYDKIQEDVAFVFQGVIVAVILFGVCATICVLSACIYCCRISIMDYRLKNDVEALAEKLKRECHLKKSIKRTPLKPVSETCNIIDAEAGIFCV